MKFLMYMVPTKSGLPTLTVCDDSSVLQHLSEQLVNKVKATGVLCIETPISNTLVCREDCGNNIKFIATDQIEHIKSMLMSIDGDEEFVQCLNAELAANATVLRQLDQFVSSLANN